MTTQDYFQVELSNQDILMIPLEKVAEILTTNRNQICPIPGVHHGILGITNQRGRLLWVMELNPQKYQQQQKMTIVVISYNNKRIGCIVAKLKGIVSIDSTEELISNNKIDEQKYIKALVNIDGGIGGILDVEEIFIKVGKKHNTLVA